MDGKHKIATKETLKLFLYIYIVKNVVSCGSVQNTSGAWRLQIQ
jgi:hypothetical protein